MMKKIITFLFLVGVSIVAHAQIGAGNMEKMNALLQQYGGDNVTPIRYEARFGLVHQTVVGYTDHFTISDMKKIIITKVNDGYSVQFFCDEKDPCVNHIGKVGMGQYLPSVTYFFTNEKAANSFAGMAGEIIRTDFKKEVVISYPAGAGNVRLDDVAKIDKPKSIAEKKEVRKKEVDHLSIDNYENNTPVAAKRTAKPKKKVDHLSIGNYTEVEEYEKELTPFGKKLMTILQLAEAHQLDKIKGSASKGTAQSRIKLPKAKMNYLNTYKDEDCFVAEFGTKKYYEDLQDLYFEIKDEIEANIPTVYEPTDMAFEPVYENSDDEVFHTEFYNIEDPSKPSVVIRITPDGEANTLFLRIGKR